jgi:hypothetical protein
METIPSFRRSSVIEDMPEWMKNCVDHNSVEEYKISFNGWWIDSIVSERIMEFWERKRPGCTFLVSN